MSRMDRSKNNVWTGLAAVVGACALLVAVLCVCGALAVV